MNDSPYTAPRYQGTGLPELAPEHTVEVRGLQIVTAGLVMGACFFMAVALFVNNGALSTKPDFLSWFAVGFAGLLFMLHLVIPGIIRRRQIQQMDVGAFQKRLLTDQLMQLLNIVRGPHIVACALLEGAAFFNLICYLITEFVGNLGVAVLLLLAIAARFPTQSRMTSWMTDVRHEIETR